MVPPRAVAEGATAVCVVDEGPPWGALLLCGDGWTGGDCGTRAPPSGDISCPGWCLVVGGTCNASAATGCSCPYPSDGFECRGGAPPCVVSSGCVCDPAAGGGGAPPPALLPPPPPPLGDGCPACPVGSVPVCRCARPPRRAGCPPDAAAARSISRPACVCAGGSVAYGATPDGAPLCAPPSARVQPPPPLTFGRPRSAVAPPLQQQLIVGALTAVAAACVLGVTVAFVVWRRGGYAAVPTADGDV